MSSTIQTMPSYPSFSMPKADPHMIDMAFIPIDEAITTGKKPFFTQEEKAQLISSHIPCHIAIIPDGNRRWAKARGKPYVFGYAQGVHSLVKTALAAKELGITYMTMYSFSTENWKRPKEETDVLMMLIERHLLFYEESMKNAGITIEVIGDISLVPLSLQKVIQQIKASTKKDPCLFTLTLAINYGGRDELLRAFRKLVQESPKEELLQSLNETLIAQALDTKNMPEPDLIIRASGEKRLSNFLLWQASYAEMYIEEDHWPEYTPHHLLHALLDYQRRERRMGGKSFQAN